MTALGVGLSRPLRLKVQGPVFGCPCASVEPLRADLVWVDVSAAVVQGSAKVMVSAWVSQRVKAAGISDLIEGGSHLNGVGIELVEGVVRLRVRSTMLALALFLWAFYIASVKAATAGHGQSDTGDVALLGTCAPWD